MASLFKITHSVGFDFVVLSLHQFELDINYNTNQDDCLSFSIFEE